ncbi:hypothetical protein DICVIV_09775 [Dictyocaulus viviparus]|uniref:GPAT/DHAPAT C-terminal domain-containing protein n=1 Tax=Dictyocaulus viviparus TaxID=29172 RepID=A0A0D8XHX9_DICVI|nr:hypothetical protein DICVIV_09775 [Dictyocaulus viviparus]
MNCSKLFAGTILDCYLVPVSYTYDNIVEGTFLDELIGIPKTRESVFGVFCAVVKGFGKSKQCGVDYIVALKEVSISCDVIPQLERISHPYSYRELLPWDSAHMEKPYERNLIQAIGYHIVYEAQSMVSISLVSVGVPLKLLYADCQWLCDQVIRDGSDVMGWHMGETCSRNAVEYALPYLGNCIVRRVTLETKEIEIVLSSAHRQLICVAYNKNALLPLFALRSAIGLVMMSRAPEECKYKNIIEDTALICDWMQFEVIFCKPCDDIREVIAVTIGRERLGHIQHGLLRLKEDGVFGSGNCTEVEIRDIMSRHILLFYSNFLRPFIQSLYIVIDRLLQGDHIVDESATIRKWCQLCVASEYLMPFSLLLEAVNSDSFRNSLRLLRHKGILSEDSEYFNVLEGENMRARLIKLLTVEQ